MPGSWYVVNKCFLTEVLCLLLTFLSYLLHLMITFADFNNILPSKILWMQKKVPPWCTSLQLTHPRVALQTGLVYTGGQEGLGWSIAWTLGI